MKQETVSLPDPEEMEMYRATARRRYHKRKEAVRRRREHAWSAARKAAAMLRERYGVTRVVVFGSLLDERRFSQWSDVDMAAWGLTSQNWLRAIGDVRDCSREVEINLVDVGCCSQRLLKKIEKTGRDL